MASMTARLAKFSLAISSRPCCCRRSSRSMRRATAGIGIPQRGVVIETHPCSWSILATRRLCRPPANVGLPATSSGSPRPRPRSRTAPGGPARWRRCARARAGRSRASTPPPRARPDAGWRRTPCPARCRRAAPRAAHRAARRGPPPRARSRDSRRTRCRWCPGRAARSPSARSSSTSRAFSSKPAWSEPMGMTSGIWYLMYKNRVEEGRRRRTVRATAGSQRRATRCSRRPSRHLLPSIHIRSSPPPPRSAPRPGGPPRGRSGSALAWRSRRSGAACRRSRRPSSCERSCGQPVDLAVDVDHAAAVDHVVRGVQDAPLLEQVAVAVLGELVVGAAGDDLDLEPRQGVVVDRGAERAGRVDVGRLRRRWPRAPPRWRRSRSRPAAPSPGRCR